MGAYFFTQLFETVRIGLSITGKEKRERREDSFSPSGLGHFSPDKRISDYSPDDLLWNRPSIKDTYFRKTLTVFGHTPTDYYGMENSGRMLKTDTWIDIDTGAASGGHPMLLRLDDERPFYVKQ